MTYKRKQVRGKKRKHSTKKVSFNIINATFAEPFENFIEKDVYLSNSDDSSRHSPDSSRHSHDSSTSDLVKDTMPKKRIRFVEPSVHPIHQMNIISKDDAIPGNYIPLFH